jgi:hypothetical protein
MESCNGCRFWLNWDSEFTNLGECHRFPPRMANIRETGPEGPVSEAVRPQNGGWPLTLPEDWCGEFQSSGSGSTPQAETRTVSRGEPAAGDTGPAI